ncbi:flagellar motor protein [Alicyclobacillaceae bacterium I2511]|nr:flagellar motor protein [Alicyclobacillaceae bacterium I2511]
MDLATMGGVVLAVVALLLGFTLDGGSMAALANLAAFILVIGGTLGATLTSVSFFQFIKAFKALRVALVHRSPEPLAVVENLVALAAVARREGLLALEERLEGMDDDFLRRGVQWVVDGVDPELVRGMMETDLSYIEERHHKVAHVFETAGGFAPTMGIIGTVMGLVHVLGNLSDINRLGPEIATAFTATLYGVASANVVWLPLANKLKSVNEQEMLLREVIMEGVLSIQAGENPNILGEKLRTFLAPGDRHRKSESEAGEVSAQTAGD